MRLTDTRTGEIFVERDPARAGLELQIGNINTEGARFVRLTREEARRLAALILFQAARLDRPGASWRPSPAIVERRSA